MIARALGLGILLAGGVAAAAVPTVAVMPFKDLSGGRGAIGEAIRETVTSDLKDVSGVRVIERGAIDRVLAEQSLQAQRSDLDASSTVKVGRLLGASMIVTGAYQRAASTVRLTARFVRVETGEIVGTAKVDGAAGELLSLQDRVTIELLRSAGIDGAVLRRAAQRKRPVLRGLRGVELYGDAVVEADDEKRGAILRQALDAEPGFVYALHDLEALERRLKVYAASATAAQDKAHRELVARIAAERDPRARAQMQVQMLGALVTARRYRRLVHEARAILAGPTPPPAPGNVRVDEVAAFYVLTAHQALRERDALLHDGEAFLKRYPTSMYFPAVQSQVSMAIDEKRAIEAGRTAAPQRAAELPERQRWNPCNLARVYEREKQHAEAQRLYRACVAAGTEEPATRAIEALVGADLAIADWAAARRDLDALEAAEAARTPKDPGAAARRANIERGIPVDDG